MAKVFAVPNYRGATEARHSFTRLGTSDRNIDSIIEAADWSNEAMRHIVLSESTLSDAEKTRIETALEMCSDSVKARTASITASRLIAELKPYCDLVWDGDACFGVLLEILAGRLRVKNPSPATTSIAASLGDAMFAVGYAGGYGSPIAAKEYLKEASIESVEVVDGTPAVNWMVFADNLRLGASPSSAPSLPFVVFEEETTLMNCAHIRSSLSECIPSAIVYTIGFLLVIRFNGRAYIMNKNSRYNLASCVYTIANWAMAGALDERAGAKEAAITGIRFVTEKLVECSRSHTSPCVIARAMKSSYALILAGMQEGLPAHVRNAQRDALEQEVRELQLAGESWHSRVSSLDIDLAVDYGTAWNLLPPADIDSAVFVESLKSKVGSKHTHNKEGWDDFVSYSLSVITARYLNENPDAVVTWASGRADDPAWAHESRINRTGAVYPNHDERDHIIKAIPWKRHLENWHHSAQDVTHIMSDITTYRKGAPRVAASVANELLYVLHNGSLLSGMYTPTDIRSRWEKGSIPGDRVLYCAGKSENTKYGAKVRETISADDVLRECLSEIDANMATLSSYVGGVAMRAGRAGTEKLIDNVLAEARSGGTLISMDVSGWSPNMDRAGEMQFIDGLMSMFDVPDTMRCSCIFRDLNIVFDKHPCHTIFPMVDGSVQGFFGTADTIMHSLLAQYVLNKAKRDGHIEDIEDAVVAKVCLIDDILLSVKNTTAPIDAVLDMFKTGYAALGFTVDVVKSLVGNRTGVFLNRVYTSKGEITTSAKIFAKADREWDRPVVGIYDEVSSILSGYSGAADRGFSAVRAYRAACFRIAMRMLAAAHNASVGDRIPTALVAFLPPSLGGLGVPDFASWISEMAGASIAAHINVVCVSYLHAATTDATVARICRAVLNYVAYTPVKTSNAWTVASSPGAVSHVDFEDPISILSSAIAKAIARKRITSEIASLITARPTEEHISAISSILAANSYDAHLLSDFLAATPPAVGEVIMARFVKSTACSCLVRPADLLKARRKISHISRRVVSTAYTRVLEDPSRTVYVEATQIAAMLIKSRIGTLKLSNAVIPAPLDIVHHVGVESDIQVFLGARISRSAATGSSAVLRTYSCSVVESGMRLNDRDMGPFGSSARRAIRALSFIAAGHSNTKALSDLFCDCWGIPRGSVPAVAVPDVNPRRISLATASRNHSIRAYPNAHHTVTIKMSQALTKTEAIRTNVDMMSIRTILAASALADMDIIDLAGYKRNYAVVITKFFMQESTSICKDVSVPSASSLVPTTASSAFAAALSMAIAGDGVITIIESSAGVVSVLAPDSKLLSNVVRLSSVKSLASAITSSMGYKKQLQDQTRDDIDPVAGIAKIDATAVRNLANIMSEAFNECQGVARVAARVYGRRIMSAADATKIAPLQRATAAALKLGNDDVQRDYETILMTCTSAASSATGGTLIGSLRNAYADRYDEERARILSENPDGAGSKALTYGKLFLATMCRVTAQTGFTYGSTATRAAYLSIAACSNTILARSGLAALPIADDNCFSMDFVDACAGAVANIFPGNYADFDSIVAGVRYAAKRMAAFLDEDNAAVIAQSQPVIATTEEVVAHTAVDSVMAMFRTMSVGIGGLSEEVDVVPAEDRRNADDDS